MSTEATNRRLFIASFLTLIAAGMGFAIRGGILGVWESKFGFTKLEVGEITGGGLTGFGVVIILCSVFADKIGYKLIMLTAFVLHIVSAIVTIAATPVFQSYEKGDPAGKDAAYTLLFVGMFIFAIANGLCEAVINPLTAALYPKKKTHYLNILHAGWPGGLILGAVLAYLFVGTGAKAVELRWEFSICLFLIPTVLYGLMIIKEKFPQSEARAAGVSFGTMLMQFTAPVLLLLLLLHAMVGYVELGTDSWIINIMENVIGDNALLLFIYTSAIMFVLRFFAGPIVERINPIGLLLISALLGAAGLFMLGSVQTLGLVLFAGTVYGLGKTFLWPTMLGVVGERFPKGGALTMGAMGGIGMLSAGLLGGPVIGYQQDLYATQHLKDAISEDAFLEFVKLEEDDDKKPIMGADGKPQVKGLDATKVSAVKEKKKLIGTVKGLNKKISDNIALTDTEKKTLAKGEETLAKGESSTLTDAEKSVLDAGIHGGQMALIWTAVVPVMMAIGYLGLLLYFRKQGGYKTEIIHDASEPGK